MPLPAAKRPPTGRQPRQTEKQFRKSQPTIDEAETPLRPNASATSTPSPAISDLTRNSTPATQQSRPGPLDSASMPSPSSAHKEQARNLYASAVQMNVPNFHSLPPQSPARAAPTTAKRPPPPTEAPAKKKRKRRGQSKANKRRQAGDNTTDHGNTCNTANNQSAPAT